MQVQFLYSASCKHNDQGRSALRKALADLRLAAYVEDIAVVSEEDAARLGFPGSPTIRINGRDIAPEGPPSLGCRIYMTPAGKRQEWPDEEALRWALESAQTPVGCCG